MKSFDPFYPSAHNNFFCLYMGFKVQQKSKEKHNIKKVFKNSFFLLNFAPKDWQLILVNERIN